jgi:RNA polymerase sigma-70 factor, ECF subfamily
MDSLQSIRNAILVALPPLRAYAVILVGSKDRADDLIQRTLVRALAQVDTSQFGTKTLAWLITILRRHLVSEYRSRCHEAEGARSRHFSPMLCQPGQDIWTEFQHFGNAVARLPLDQREAIVLVEGSGFSYEQAAEICGCPAQTIKSRVSRAFNTLARALPNQSATFSTGLNSHAAAKPAGITSADAPFV